MTVDETLDVQPVASALTTTSGARIEPITVEVAQTFVRRLDQMDHLPAVVDDAWGAFADATLIGVGVLALSGSLKGRAFVGVALDRRRLGVGTELFEVLVTEAMARDLATLTCIHPASDPGAQRLARALGLTTARRLCGKTAVMVVILAKPLRDQNGDS